MRAAAFCLLRVNTNSIVTALIPNNPTVLLVLQNKKRKKKKEKIYTKQSLKWLFLTQVQCAVITCTHEYVNECMYLISWTYKGPFGWKFIIAQNIFASLKLLGYLQVSKDRVLLDAREQNSHGVCAVVQEWDTSSVQIAGQLMNVCLQLCKRCGRCTTNRLKSLKFSLKLENLCDSGNATHYVV